MHSPLIQSIHRTLTKAFFLACLFALTTAGFAQTDTLTGIVKDIKNGEPLPFAHIVSLSTGKGVTSNAKGEFTLITNTGNTGNLYIISYVGYYSDTLNTDSITSEKAVWMLKPSAYSLEAVTVKPGINPAVRIMQKVIKNKVSWAPSSLQAYAYDGYHKMRFVPYRDTTNNRDESPVADSAMANRTIAKSDVFLIETASEKFVEPPDRVHESIKAYRISGTSNPLFSYLNTQLQSLSFYNKFFSILDRKYISPLSNKALQSYHFQIEDTLFHEQYDTLYILSYRPKMKNAAEGLAGLLQISTRGYALAGATARATNKEDNIEVQVRQKYEMIEMRQWFPTELQTQILFEDITLQDTPRVILKAEALSELHNIRINPELPDSLWKRATLEQDSKIVAGDDPQWANYRTRDLSKRDSLTYHVIDSLGKRLKLDLLMNATEVLLSGNIRIGKIDVPIYQLVQYNRMEGFRPGLGFQTNKHLHEHWTYGGFAGYGLKDQRWKYGSNIAYFFNRTTQNFAEINYEKDVEERGGLHFLGLNPNAGTEIFRPFLVQHFDYAEKIGQRFQFWPQRDLMMQVNLSYTQYHSRDGYQYQPGSTVFTSNYQCYTASIHGRFAPAEKQLQTKQRLYPLGTRYPILFFNLSKAFPLGESQTNYLKVAARLSYTYKSPNWGQTYLSITGGFLNGKAPAVRLFNGQGSYNQFSVQADNSFATMRMNEFFATQFLHFHLKHDLGARFYRTTFSAPHLVLIHGMAIGRWENKQHHQFPYQVKDLSKGYLESGLMISNLLKTSIIGYGAGIFYRYGPYSLPTTNDNIGYKLVFTINL